VPRAAQKNLGKSRLLVLERVELTSTRDIAAAWDSFALDR
jgi:hypothetical protein